MTMDMQVIMSTLIRLGREPEQTTIAERLKALSLGRGGSILLKCEQETGENLLVRALLRETGIPCCHGVCQPYPLLEPYEAFAQNFARFFSRFRLENLHSFTEALSEFKNPFYRGIWGKIARKVTRRKMRETPLSYSPYILHLQFARHFLKEQKLPLVFFLEDIHWADLATFRLLLFLLHAFRDHPVLFIFTACPDILDASVLPSDLKDANIPVIQKLQAVQPVGRLPLSSKGRREFIGEIENLASDVLFLKPFDDAVLVNVVKKVIGPPLPDDLLAYIVNLCQGNVFFLGQTLSYLFSNVLTLRGTKWQLQREVRKAEIPHITFVLESNVKKLDAAASSALKCAAIFGTIVPLALWEKVIEGDSAKIFRDCCEEGILTHSLSGESLIFNSFMQRDVILRSLSSEEQRRLHSAWASMLASQDISFIRVAYHKRYGEPSSTIRENILNAGLAAERMLAFEEAYHFYRQAADLYPEIKETFATNLREIREKFEKKEDIRSHLPEFVLGLRYYRIAALGSEPLFKESEKDILKRAIYKDTPDQFFPTLGPLALYLTKVLKLDKKAYPQEDIVFLVNLVTGDLIPGRDYLRSALLWEELALHKPIPARQRMPVVKCYERWGNSEKDSQEKCQKYLTAAFFAKRLEDFFEAARILHKINRLCMKEIAEKTIFKHYQIEALRLLGEAYEKWAVKEKEDEQKVRRAIQATSAYRDAVSRIWDLKEASWLAQRLMEKCLTLCENYYLENELILEALKSARVKAEMKAEEEYTGKALIVVDEEDMGCAELLEGQVFEEGLYPEIALSLPHDFMKEKEVPGYRCSFLVCSSYSTLWKNAIEYLRPALALEGKDRAAWFIHETSGHLCFTILADHPGELYRAVLELCSEKVLRRYV